MQDTIFENETLYDLKTYSEAMDKYIMLNPKTLKRLGLVVIFMIVYGFALSKSLGNILILILYIALFVAIFAIFRVFKINEKKALKKALYLNPSGITRSYFSEDGFFLENDSSSSTLNYSKITHVGETKNLIVLILQNSIAILDKSTFSKGNFIDFNEFIARKCPSAKLKFLK